MIRNVVGAYLDQVTEREFDIPFLALLASMGYYDIHFTHGQVEFGKDFIAKKKFDQIELQFSFQSKAGDINQSTWRSSIMTQMTESILVGLSHPNFDRELPHQAVLVTTGRLLGNVALGLQDLNRKLTETYRELPIKVWDRENLSDNLVQFGLEGLYHETSDGFLSLGRFFILHGKSLKGNISSQEIESHSRQWLNTTTYSNKQLLGATLEFEILSKNCENSGFCYEAIQAHLAALRTIMHYEYVSVEESETRFAIALYDNALKNLESVCHRYLQQFRQAWEDADRDLVLLTNSSAGFITYLVHCARVMEIAGFMYFLAESEETRSGLINFILDFSDNEPGFGHIPSDNYATSLLFPILALIHAKHIEIATEIIKRSVVWICDRAEQGFGLAAFGSDPVAEINTLLGYPFAFIDSRRHSGSFASTLMIDLAAFIRDDSLYQDIINDLIASNIFPQYWQVPDTKGVFEIESEDIIAYPNITYTATLSDTREFEYAEHIRHESRDFKPARQFGILSLFLLTLLLRDRYFPTTWKILIHAGST